MVVSDDQSIELGFQRPAECMYAVTETRVIDKNLPYDLRTNERLDADNKFLTQVR